MALETDSTLLQAHFVAALPWTKPLWATVPRLYNKESYQYQIRCDLCKALEHGHWHKRVTQRRDLASSSLKLPHKPGHELRNGGKCQKTKNSPLRNTTSRKPPAFLPGKAPWNMRVYTNCPLFLVTKLTVQVANLSFGILRGAKSKHEGRLLFLHLSQLRRAKLKVPST